LKTIKDIARLAGVSQSTVSKALNDRPDVSAETKRRIREIAREHDFVPNAFGKGLKRRLTENIGVIFCRELHPLSGNPFYSRVLEGIEAEATLNNFSLVLHIILETTRTDLPKMVRERQVDGVILIGTFSEEFIQRILATKMHLVFVDPKRVYENAHQVLIDNEHGAFLATQYLIECGHRRIGFISGDLSRLSFRQRFDGYLKALSYHKVPFDERLIRTGGLENGYDHVRDLLTHEQVTAIFSANDINALYGYKAIRDLGLRIPEDISVVGFDDIELAHITTPPLTTVRVYKEELGSIAVRTLLRLVRKQSGEPATTIVPVRLIERESVRKLQPIS